MIIPTILTAITWIVAVTIPIVGAYKSYKKLQNTRKKLKDSLQHQQELVERHHRNLAINQLMYDNRLVAHPNIDAMRLIVAHDYKSVFQNELLEAYKVKLISEETEVTPLEATMSPLQLYKAGNPLWAKPFAPLQVQMILYHDNKETIENIFQRHLLKDC